MALAFCPFANGGTGLAAVHPRNAVQGRQASQEGGYIRVDLRMRGPVRDPDGCTVSIAAGEEHSIQSDETKMLGPLPEGRYSVVLSGLSRTCTVATGLVQTVNVTAGATALVRFDAECAVPLPPTLTLDRIALAVPVDGTDTVELTATGPDGRPDSWEARSSDEQIATLQPREASIIVRGRRPGQAELTVRTRSGAQRKLDVTVYHPLLLEVGDLLVKYVTDFEFLYRDPTWDLPIHPAPTRLAYFQPVVTGEGWRPLASLARQDPLEDIDGKAWTIAVKAGPTANSQRPPLRDPVGFELEWTSPASPDVLRRAPLPHRNRTFSLWTPICPEDYVPMGTVGVRSMPDSTGKPEPDRSLATCLRQDLTVAAGPGWWQGQPGWSETRLNLYQVACPVESSDDSAGERTCLEAGTFVAFGEKARHPTHEYGRKFRQEPVDAKERDGKIRREVRLRAHWFKDLSEKARVRKLAACESRWPEEHPDDLWLCLVDQTTRRPEHRALNVLAVSLPMLIDREEAGQPALSSLGEPPRYTPPFLTKSMLVPVTALGEGFADDLLGPDGYIERSPFVRLERSARFRLMDSLFCDSSPLCDKPGLEVTTNDTTSVTLEEAYVSTVGTSFATEISATLEIPIKWGAKVTVGGKRTRTVTTTQQWSRGLAESVARSESVTRNHPCPAQHRCAAWTEETVVEMRRHSPDRLVVPVDGTRLRFSSGNVEFRQFP